jgi:hypothetical protein
MACNSGKEKTTEPAVSGASEKKAGYEFADQKYSDVGKSIMNDMASGNVTAWLTHFSENSVYSWSSGDSLVGKKAIGDYWTNRWKTVLDSLHYSNDIWMPVKVITPQRGPDMPGVWLLNWNLVTAKYKNGKTLNFWVHTDYHFDSNDKVDRTVMYIDRGPINAALATK